MRRRSPAAVVFRGLVIRVLPLAAALLLVLTLPRLAAADPESVTFTAWVNGREESRRALICRPPGDGPFPVVVFNHGSIVDGWGWPGASGRGYRLDRVCEALARDGMLVFAPIREPAPRGRGFQAYEPAYREIVTSAVDHAKRLPGVDPARVALAGFSMGGLVSFQVSTDRDDLRAVVLLAPAAGRGVLHASLPRARHVTAPVLVLVEATDVPPIRQGVDDLARALGEAGRAVTVVRYDRGGGHELFYDLGYWWDDARGFLRGRLGIEGAR